MDWQVGDLALCIRQGVKTNIRRGAVYTVLDVRFYQEWSDCKPGVGLILDGVNHPNNAKWGGVVHENHFRKVTPPEADAFDREVIDLMMGNPVKVSP